MNDDAARVGFPMALCMFLFLCVLLAASSVAADDREDQRHGRRHDGRASSHEYRKGDDGHEFTGYSAALIFAVANMTVVFSLLSRGLVRYAPMNKRARETIKRVNKFQKKYLISLHYYLNPAALTVALVHFGWSACRKSSLPEWGLFLTAFLALTGVLVKFKLTPGAIRKTVWRFHRSPFPVAVVLAILIVGHGLAD